jgi:hypothetical protein
MGLAVLTSVLSATGGLEDGLGATLLATAAFPLAGCSCSASGRAASPPPGPTHA